MKIELTKKLKTILKRCALKSPATGNWQLATALLLAIGMGQTATAQDINFSQFYELPLLRNPALAGVFTGDLRITGVWRNQWNSVTVPYRTQALASELKFNAWGTACAAGLQITNDKAGDSKLGRFSVSGAVAAYIPVDIGNESHVSAGFMGGIVRQRFAPENLSWNAQFVNGVYDPTAPTGQNFNAAFATERNYFDLSAGVMFNTNIGNDIRLYTGVAGYHFSTGQRTFRNGLPDSSLSRSLKLVVNGGLSLPSSDFDRVILYTDVFFQGGARQVQGGILYRHDILQDGYDFGIAVSGGVFTRWGDAVMPMLKLDYYNWGVGFTYDANVSKLSKASGGVGGFEVTASYTTPLNIRNEEARKVMCPRF